MNRRLAIAVALALPATLTACNSSSSHPVTQQSPSSAVTTPPASSTPSAGDDKTRAAAIQVKATDLPQGWKAQAITTTAAKQREEDAYFDACLHVPTIETEQTTSSDVEFGRPDGLAFVDGLINVTQTDAQAQQDLAALTGPRAVNCSLADARKFVTPPKGTTIVRFAGSRLSVPAGEIGIRTVETLKLSNGREITLTADDIGIIVKRFEVQVSFTSAIQPPQQSLETAVTAAVFARAMTNAA